MANRTELVAAARDLRGTIEADRAWADEHARMAPEVVRALRDAGLFTMIAPREVGGAEVAFPEGIAVFEELGYSDPSAAWHVANAAALESPARLALPVSRPSMGSRSRAATVQADARRS